MKILRQVLIILSFWFGGEIVHKFLAIPIPGSVIGMLALFLCLYTGILKLDSIAEISKFLIDHLAFFFLPAGVGLIAAMNVLKDNWIAIVLISIITTMVVIVVTGYTVQTLQKYLKTMKQRSLKK